MISSSALLVLPALFALLLLLLLALAHTASAVRIVDYVNTFVSSGDIDAANAWWANYDASFFDSAGVKEPSFGEPGGAAAYADDSVALQPLDICAPFYTREKNRLFLDSNGFVSLQPFSMCGSFCVGFHRDYGWIGTYGFDNKGTGGDWPMIAAYLYDLEISAGQVRYKREYARGNYTTVEFKNVKQFSSLRHTGSVNLQLVIYTNGTIVIRVRSVLGGSFAALNPAIPDTGIVFSRSQRYLAAVMSTANVTSWRFQPVYDPCQTHDGTNCDTCVSSGAAHGCVWCAGTKSCTKSTVSRTVCLSESDTFSSVMQCAANGGIFTSDKTLFQQVFYNVSLQSRDQSTIGSASCQEKLADYAQRSSGFIKYRTYYFRNNNIAVTSSPSSTSSSPSSSSSASSAQKTLFPVRIVMPFNVSFFNFPARGAASQSAMDRNKYLWDSNELFIYESGIVKIGSQHEFPLDCDRVRGYCAMMNYPAGVVTPFGSYNVGLDSVAGVASVVEIAERIPATSRSTAHLSPFCDAALALSNTANPTHCAAAVAVEFQHIVFVEQYGRKLRSSLHRTNKVKINVTARLYIDQVGNIGVQVGRVAAADVDIGTCGDGADGDRDATLGGWVYPHPTVGAVRFGRFDFSTMAAPYQAVSDNSVFWFSPVRGCPSCNGNGGCDTATNTCSCKIAFAGETCSLCAPGYYGRFCDACPVCKNGGSCDDGEAGSGSCVCVGQWSGEFCEVDCGTAAAARCANPSCSLFGGICTCGTCACRTADGWYDVKNGCALWRDPCDKNSLAGCKACEQNRDTKKSDGSIAETNQCYYCRDADEKRCQSNATRRRINVSDMRPCGEPQSEDTGVEGCPIFFYPQSNSLEYNGTLGIIAFVLLTILTGVGLFALLCCRGHTPNPYFTNAVSGVPEFRRPPREREVIQVRICDPRRQGLLQAIPLKTVSMLDLYRYQRARRTGSLETVESTDESGNVVKMAVGVPGAEYLRQRLEKAEQDAAAFVSAGPIPASSKTRRAGVANSNNSNNNTSNASSVAGSPSAPTLVPAAAAASSSYPAQSGDREFSRPGSGNEP